MLYPVKTLSQLPLVLKAFRKEKGLTQAAMAEKLGITQQSYAYFEARPATATLERLFTVLRLLNVDISLAQAAPVVGMLREVATQIGDSPLVSSRMHAGNATSVVDTQRKLGEKLVSQNSHYLRADTAKESKGDSVKVVSQAARGLSAKAKPLAVPSRKKEDW